jgi:hypothetical protein
MTPAPPPGAPLPPPSPPPPPPPRYQHHAQLTLPSPEEVIARVWGTAAGSQRVSESLDYEPVQNRVSRDRCRREEGGAGEPGGGGGHAGGGGGGHRGHHSGDKRRVYGYTGHTLAKTVVTIATGVSTGAFAWAMSAAMGAAGGWRVARVQAMLDEAAGWGGGKGVAGVAAAAPNASSSSSLLLAAASPPPPPPPLPLLPSDSGGGVFVSESNGSESFGPDASRRRLQQQHESEDDNSNGGPAPPPPPPPAFSPARAAWPAFLWNAAFSCLLVSFAVGLVQYWAPQAAGAGVTLVMAYLNGNHVPNLLRGRTLVAKFVGTVCSVSAGLPMGPEGPMVHIGACVGSLITYAQCGGFSWSVGGGGGE